MFRLALLISFLVTGIVFIGGVALYKILEALFLVVCFFITILLGVTLGSAHRKSRSTYNY
jgi:hypothetical protein